MGLFIRVRQPVQVQAVEGQAFWAQRDLGQLRPPLGVELVAVHPHVARRILVPDKSGLQQHFSHGSPLLARGLADSGESFLDLRTDAA